MIETHESFCRNQWTLGRVFGSLVVLTLVVSVVSPALKSLLPRSDTENAMQNAHRLGKAAFAYAESWEGVLPRMDNNGSCLYLENPCQTPDWNVALAPGGDPNRLGEGSTVMFFGALRAHMDDIAPPYDTGIGRTNWQSAHGRQAEYGITMMPTYDQTHEEFYFWTLSQMAVNVYMVDHNQPEPNSASERPFSPRGRLSWIMNDAVKILFTMESTVNYTNAVFDGVGNSGVWPSRFNPGTPCYRGNQDGWTFYVLKGTRGLAQNLIGSPLRETQNPNLQGKAMFLFADMHAEALTYPQAEQCIPTPSGWNWYSNLQVPQSMYYPKWVPEVE